ncbi:MAG: hypothetical protein P8I61_05290 [Opitutae bacterium]|nr:hypothetical protein [Opitutae bacterium]
MNKSLSLDSLRDLAVWLNSMDSLKSSVVSLDSLNEFSRIHCLLCGLHIKESF